MDEGTIKFLAWLDEERDRRGISQNWLENNALDLAGNPLSRGTISAIRAGQVSESKERRKLTAEHVIRIARALRVQFLQALEIAGYINREEVSLSKTFIPDNQYMGRIWANLIDLDQESLALAEKPIIAIIEACKRKGGDFQDETQATQTGYG